jgi:hypothetical protein
MAIYRLLAEASFSQDDIDRMAAAYEAVLDELQLMARADPVMEMIAKKIMEITVAASMIRFRFALAPSRNSGFLFESNRPCRHPCHAGPIATRPAEARQHARERCPPP